MKMIVTGSEGFIGKALCQELKRRDVEVIGIDRKNGKDAASISMETSPKSGKTTLTLS